MAGEGFAAHVNVFKVYITPKIEERTSVCTEKQFKASL